MVNVVTVSFRLKELIKHVLKIMDRKSLLLQRNWETELEQVRNKAEIK